MKIKMITNFFLLIFLFSCFLLKAQDYGLIKINGVVKGTTIENGTASIIPISIGLDCIAYKFDSFTVAVINNHFHFSGTMPYPHGFEEIIFRSNKTGFRTGSFFLDSGNIDMTCFYNPTGHSYPEIKFCASNNEYQNKFLPLFQPAQNLLDSFLEIRDKNYKKYDNAIPDTVYQDILRVRNLYTTKKNSLLRKYIKQNPDSYIPLAMIGEYVEREDYDLPEIEKTFDLLSSKMKNTISGMKLKKAMDLKDLRNLGDTLKSLVFVDKQNKECKLNFDKNKYTLVDFWFSNCGPCISQFPQLKSIYDTYKNKGFGIIGISTDENESEWKNAIANYDLNWQQIWDKENYTSGKLLISGFPSNFLIDSNGTIIESNIEIFRLKQFLQNKLLGN